MSTPDTIAVRGTLTPDRPLADLTWLRVGGPADWLFQPADTADLAAFLADSPECRTAFADQLFHYTIKQPSDAFGANRAAELSELFAAEQLNIRRLLREIVISSAEQMRTLDPPAEASAAR
jgi:hypothetical protein